MKIDFLDYLNLVLLYIYSIIKFPMQKSSAIF